MICRCRQDSDRGETDMAKLLIVDDDIRLRRLVKTYGEVEQYECEEAADGLSALEKLQDDSFDLVILDVMMPGLDGFETLERIRKTSEIPVIMLTARSEEYDKLTGFRLGVDDYVSKPFSPKELMARVGAVLKRNRKTSAPISFTYGELQIHPDSRTASISGKELVLAPKEFDLLLELAKNPGTVMKRDKLLQDVWGYSYCGDGRTVDTHIKAVRDRLGPYRTMIQTVWGVGYKFDPDAKVETL